MPDRSARVPLCRWRVVTPGVLLAFSIGWWGLSIAPERVAVAADAPSGEVATPPQTPPERVDSQVVQRLRDDVKYLASDELEGRGVGLAGLDRAAEYITQQFAAAGLDVTRVNGSARQEFTITSGSKLGDGNHVELVSPEGEVVPLEMGRDYEVGAFGGSGSFDVPLVFGGYAISAPDNNYDDFVNIDVKGKGVIAIRRAPRQGDSGSPFDPHSEGFRHAELRTKLNRIGSHDGVLAVIVNDPATGRGNVETVQKLVSDSAQAVVAAADLAVTQEFSDDIKGKLANAVAEWRANVKSAGEVDPDPLMKFGYAQATDNNQAIPAIHLSQAVANRILGAIQTNLDTLEKSIDAELKPQSREIPGWRIRGKVAVELVRTPVANVIGVLEATGPLADQTVVVGAHYDHVGRGGANSLAPGSNDVHNGADDNASGTIALLELARELGKQRDQLKRRVVFIAFTGEEMGLLGSAHYVKEPVFPLESTIAMLNFDMVGRLQGKLTVFGSGTSSRWEAELKEAAAPLGLNLAFEPEGFGPSDHSSFYGKKIPVLHFFSGTHPDYHRPTDDWEKLNLVGVEQVVALAESMLLKTVGAPERPDYIEIAQPANIGRAGSRPYVGTIPDFGNEAQGYAISGAAADSPAQKGGLQAGDVITRVGETAVKNLDDFDMALRELKPGQTVEFVVQRAGGEVKLNIVLEPPR